MILTVSKMLIKLVIIFVKKCSTATSDTMDLKLMNLVIIIFFIYIFPSLFSCDNYIIFKKKNTSQLSNTKDGRNKMVGTGT